MHPLQATEPLALQLLFTEDLYLIAQEPDPTGLLAQVETQPVAHLKKHQEAQIDCEPSFDYVGQNKKQFVVLLNDSRNTVIGSDWVELMKKIIQAKGLTMDDIALVNYANYAQTSIETLKKFFSCQKLCLLGIEPQSLGLNAQTLHEIRTQDQVQLLYTYNLAEIAADQDKKRQFWQAMKNF